MKKITIERTKEGVFLITGDDDQKGYELSREITGHTGEEENCGIFGTWRYDVILYYGEYVKKFSFNSLHGKTEDEVKKEILNRVKEVREWIEECKALAFKIKINL